MNAKTETMYRCSICNKVSSDKGVADRCCQPYNCQVCGKELKPFHTLCDSCFTKDRYEKANRIKYSDYKIECFYDQGYDKYFKDREEMEEYYELQDNPDIPNWTYACEEIPFQVNIYSAIESAEENMYEDFDDIVDQKELEDFVKEWNEKQTAKAYYPDYKNIVLFSEDK